MTTKIAILNRQAVALAADSAVTIGRSRVWNNANKLFSLSPVNDIGIMIYGSGDFVGISWETIIKNFRKEFGLKVYAKVSDFGDEFLTYLRSNSFGNNVLEQKSFVELFKEMIEIVRNEKGEDTYDTVLNRKLIDS